MKSIHRLLAIVLLVCNYSVFAQKRAFPDTNFLKQEYARQQAIKAELEKLKAMQLKYQQDKKNTSSEKSTLTSLPVHWEERGPTGMPNGINQVLIDANDPSGKKAWAATWGGLWYNNDITADSSWHRRNTATSVFSIVQNPTNPQEMFYSDSRQLFRSTDGGLNWVLLLGDLAFSLKFNNQGDLFSACLETCSPNNIIFKFNRNTSQFDEFLSASTAFASENNPVISDFSFDYHDFVYVALKNGQIYKSNSASGSNWTSSMSLPLNNPSARTQIAIGRDVNHNKIIYAINLRQEGVSSNNINWIRKSADGGLNWTNLPIPMISSFQMRAPANAKIMMNPNNILEVIIGGDDVASSTDGGNTWKIGGETHFNLTSLTVAPPTNNFVVTYNDNILYLKNLFDANNISFESRIKDLNTNYLQNLGIRNEFSDSTFYYNNGILKGNPTLKKFGFSSNDFSKSFFDNNETNLLFDFKPSFTYYDRNGIPTINPQINVGSYNGKGSYDEINNVVYGFKSSSQAGNQSLFFRVKNIGDGNEIYDELIVNQYFNVNEIKAVNDSTFLVVSFSSNTFNFQIHRLVIRPDNSVNSTLLSSNNSGFSKLSTFRGNSNFLSVISNFDINLSTNGGLNWVNKTTSVPGLVSSYVINPGNADQVFLIASKKIFTTNNFTSNSVVWDEITGDLDFAPNGLLNIWFRESDGMLWVSNGYRGLFSTNYFQSQVENKIVIAYHPQQLCTGQTLKVSFYKNGPFTQNNSYELWISDATGSFVNATKIGSSTNSPIFGMIPDDFTSSNNYRLRVISTNNSFPIQYADTEPFELGKGTDVFSEGFPIVLNPTNSGFVINTAVNQSAEIFYAIAESGSSTPTINQLLEGKDSSGLAYYSSGSILANQGESIPLMINGLLTGTAYDIYLATKVSSEQCFSEIKKLQISTIGNQPSYCIPQSINGCNGNNYISQVGVFNYLTNQTSFLSNFNSGCSPNSYSFNARKIETIQSGSYTKAINLKIHDFQGTFSARGVGIWIDLNEDGDFGDLNENLSDDLRTNNNQNTLLYANNSVSPGLKRLRIRVIDGAEYVYPMSPCAIYNSGETEDYLIKVESNEPRIFANLDKTNGGQCEVIKVVMEANGTYAPSNTFKVELSNSTGQFNSPTTLFTGHSIDFPASIRIPKDIPSGTGYRIRIVSNQPVAISLESPDFSIGPRTQQVTTNYSSGTHVVDETSVVSASNKNTNTAKVNFKGWNSVILLPNFEAKPSSMGSFKAEIVGCDN
ncbi:MAG: GEVED domain-containing protein [Leadbetterella sp.]|nr:GEVED domain-containing protein [Leadbetterella sp.]